jgi:putative two-component system response regulator
MPYRKKRILIVDDEYQIRMLLERQLEAQNYSCFSVCLGEMAVNLIKKHSFDLMLLDINMPAQSGVEILREMQEAKDCTPVVMVSGYNSVDMVRMTMREGAYDYLIKPWKFEDLKFTVEKAIKYGQLVKEKKHHLKHLEKKIEERTKEAQKALAEIKETYRATILALGSALETRDTETQSHCLRVAHYSKLIAKEMGIKDEELLQNIEWGAYLHDIGKIGVPDSILLKPAALSEKEWRIMKTHPEIGDQVIESINFLKGAAPIVRYHHERYDGNGYPEGLEGDAIPIEARIFAVADALDAMLSDRPYRKGMLLSEAKVVLEKESGLQFCPRVIAILGSLSDIELLGISKTAVA